MAAHASGSNLRLVGGADPLALATWRDHQRARQDVARENHTAARSPLDPGDPRWVLAARAYSQLQGTTLTPDRRDRVLQTARLLGVRPFDANVIIAIVQDTARRGQPLGDAHGLIEMVPEPARRGDAGWGRWAAAILLATVANLFLIWWLLAG